MTTPFTLLRTETIQRIMDSAWFKTTPGAAGLVASARYCPDSVSFGAQLDVLRQVSGQDWVDLTSG